MCEWLSRERISTDGRHDVSRSNLTGQMHETLYAHALYYIILYYSFPMRLEITPHIYKTLYNLQGLLM